MKDLRIVFMGTPEFAVETLKEILSDGYDVVGVVTAPDRRAGRGRKMSASAVKEFALEKGIPVFQPTNLKSGEFLLQLEQLNPNVQVVVAFRMLPKVVWEFPEYGTFNLHASLLPQYRGAAPINWALMNGETKTGVSTFFIDDKIDTGEIIFREEISVSEDENAGELHDELMNKGAKLVVKTLRHIQNGTVQTIAQQETSILKVAPKLTPENTKISWNRTAKEIYNQIRGLSPYPGAWCFFQNGTEELRCKILKAKLKEEKHQRENGTIVQEGKELHAYAINGKLILGEIQLQGKKKMQVKELLNGFRINENATFR